MTIAMHWHDWLALFGQYMLLSLLSISGAITTVPDMHRYLVAQHGWLTDAQFSSSVAIAQAAPGPNVLFVALMGWNVGLNAGGGIGAGLQRTLQVLLQRGGGGNRLAAGIIDHLHIDVLGGTMNGKTRPAVRDRLDLAADARRTALGDFLRSHCGSILP